MDKVYFIDSIKKNYAAVQTMKIENAQAFAANIRSSLEFAVKLVWQEKLGEIPKCKNFNGRIEFNLSEAISDLRFSSCFERWTITYMHLIRQDCNDIIHGKKELTVATARELIENLEKCIKAIETLLNCSIITIYQEERVQIKNFESNPVEKKETRQKVKHARFGEGEIISIEGGVIKVCFNGFDIKKFPYPSSLDNGTLSLVQQSVSQYPANDKAGNNDAVVHDYNSNSFKSVNKFEAIKLFKNSGVTHISKNCTFASKNSMSCFYWANPKIDLLKNDWWLILNDNINYEVHLFKIPANTLNVDIIKVRGDKPYLMDLEILYGDKCFTDTRSNIQFAKWYIKTIKY